MQPPSPAVASPGVAQQQPTESEVRPTAAPAPKGLAKAWAARQARLTGAGGAGEADAGGARPAAEAAPGMAATQAPDGLPVCGASKACDEAGSKPGHACRWVQL
ncbi:hypothetical protein Rsub_01854 [Raphidocelis subcapitata]|uniref:Uncharacterized protein n=1 Tax=Raphidocelis subcapitata TaxID=307507 RepID=A0A2V0NW19_9CHLO|nr:hypothetical protein Rsub_01854 [Raphidocelis subcapitata]|eukprot:GBF89137.1 hypothetical protein Rsub_01854 [Raphidocelis subcapitata]